MGDLPEIARNQFFYVKEYDSYVGRNPKTGEKVPVEPKKLPFFKAGAVLQRSSKVSAMTALCDLRTSVMAVVRTTWQSISYPNAPFSGSGEVLQADFFGCVLSWFQGFRSHSFSFFAAVPNGPSW